MLRFIFRRLGMTAAVLLVVTTFLAVLVQIVPGDPVRAVAGPQASPEFIAQVREEMGLDEPVTDQVLGFFAGVLRGDLGTDVVSHTSVTELIAAYLPHTLILAFAALLMSMLVGIPLGVFAATRPGSLLDHVTSFISVSFITMPSYLIGLLLLLLLPVSLGVLPATGAGQITDPLDYLSHLILPAAALSIGWIGYLARIVRTSMLEVMGSTHIRAARALGLNERLIAYRYALKNAIIPTVALLGVGLGDLLGGAVFVEVIFARPGIGSLVVDSIAERNFPVVRGVVLVTALMFVAANLAADLSYRLLDPRVRVERSGRLA